MGHFSKKVLGGAVTGVYLVLGALGEDQKVGSIL